MRWVGAGVVSVALVLAGCTSSEDATAVTTSITLGASEVAAQDDAIVRYGISSSPTDPWAHYRTSCDTSCGIIFGAITDTLFATSTNAETVGLLVEDVETNNDNTLHVWELRSGITFSDGSVFDAEAARVNIDACRHSALTGPGLAGIDDVRAEGLTLTITTLAPWGNLPVHFAETPCGHMFSATWLRTLADLPMRIQDAPFFDADLASSAPIGDPTAPIGLGAFTMAAFAPGNGNSTLLQRNPSYWRGPAGITGESLPEVEQIELVVIGDDSTRRAGLEAGQFDLVHSNGPNQEAIVELGPVVQSAAFADVVHLAINSADERDNPLARVSCRRAVIRSIDREAFAAAIGAGISSGPFLDLLGDDDVEEVLAFDPAAATQWGQRCIDDHGSSVSLRLLAPIGDARADTLGEMIERSVGELPDGGGVAIEIVPAEPRDVALAALLGDFDLILWEGFSGIHPDLHFTWWYSEAAGPLGAISSNVSRIDDPAVDRALVDLRRADSVDRTDRAVEELERAMQAGAWTAWLATNAWTIGLDPGLDADLSRATPEGVELVPVINGVHTLHHIAGS